MKHYLIYQVRNKLNGIIYIGQHQTENVDDGYMGSGLRIRRAIEKYGLENFEKTILFECSSKEEMNKKEAEIVNEDFIARDDVYNIKLGGEGGWDEVNKNPLNVGANHYFKNKTREEISKHQSDNLKKYWNSLTEEQRQKVIEQKKIILRSVADNFKGKHHSEETKKKMSLTKRRNKSGVGERNSQYGTMWICNDETHESKKISKTDDILVGWRKGRFCK